MIDSTTLNVSGNSQTQPTKQFTYPEIVERVRLLAQSETTADLYDNIGIDLTKSDEFADETFATTLIEILPDMFKSAKAEKKHIVTIKIIPKQQSLYSLLQKVGFVFHQAHRECAMLTKCLEDHEENKCSYPKYKTLSVGITGVVFNRDLSKFLAIQEKVGPYKGWKAPTGSLTESKEDPLEAAVLRIAEKTGVHVKPEDGLLVSMAWTKDFRGPNPDENYVFAFRTDEKSHELKPKPTEIAKVEWLDAQQFIESKELPVSHKNPLILQAVVRAAHKVLVGQKEGWRPQAFFWGSGKQVTMFDPNKI